MNDEHKVLPLKEAYRFGGERGLERQMADIKDMEIGWGLTTTGVRRGYVVDLFTRKRLLDAFKEQCWPAGSTPWGTRHCEYCLRLKQRYEDFVARHEGIPPEEEEEQEEQAFAAETDLRDFLANNLGCVEAGLRLYQDGERGGVEFPVDDGRIDVLATDKTDRLVVFELKVARGRNKVLGQLLYYMGWVDKHLGKGPCRGIIVARDISDDLVLAVQRVQGVSLFRYKLNFSVERVS